MPEIREHPTLEGYGASRDGRVWSRKKRGSNGGLGDTWKERKLSVHKRTGYMQVHLKVSGRSKIVQVHRFVLECFVGPCPEGMECRHFPDNDRANNALDNLRWGTKAENAADIVVHGTRPSKLTEDDVRAIRTDPRLQREIAADFGIARSRVSEIKSRKAWHHLEEGAVV